MPDQAQTLREMVKGRRAVTSRVVCVTSGKGGVGKTNLAVNLALAVSRLGHRVVLLDMDLGLANADILLNVIPSANLYHVINRRKRIRDVLVPCGERLWLLPGASGVPRMADLGDAEREILASELETLEQTADWLVVDTGAGVSKNVLHFAASADETIVVTTPEPTSVYDAFAAIKLITQNGAQGGDWPHARVASRPPAGLFESGPERLRLVVNQARNRQEAFAVAEKVTGVARQMLGVHVEKMGYVLADDHVPEAIRRRVPLVTAFPGSPAGRCIQTLAEVLAGKPREAAGAEAGGRFFRTVLRRWARTER